MGWVHQSPPKGPGPHRCPFPPRRPNDVGSVWRCPECGRERELKQRMLDLVWRRPSLLTRLKMRGGG